MKLRATQFLLSFLLVSVFMSISVFASIDVTDTGGSTGSAYGPIATKVMGTEDNNSIIVKNLLKTKNIYIPSRNRNYTAGTFSGTQNGNDVKFYCIDINTGLQWNSEYIYDGQTSLQLYYVLNNYYPVGGRQFNSAPLYLSETEEAAATQLAIWHFSDGIDITNSTPTKVYQAAQTIIADANANAISPARTIEINVINDQDFKIGEPIKFVVEVYTEFNTPSPNAEVNISSPNGNVSVSTATTNANGITDTLEITQLGGATTATIEVSGNIKVPVGSRFVKKGAPNSSQKLILAGTADFSVNKSTTVNWYGEPDLSIKKTAFLNGNAANTSTTVKHGDNVSYTIAVTNNANAGAAATNLKVSDILPTVLTGVNFSSTQGTYSQVNGLWEVGDLAVGQTATLTINAQVELGNNGSGGVYDLGPAADYNLFVLNNVKNAYSDTEGKVAVGRDATFFNYSVGDKLPPNSGDVLVVNRRLTYNTGRVYNGSAVYGSFIDTTNANLADDGIRKEKNVIDFAYAKTHLKTLSKQLFALPANGTVTHDGYGRLDFVGTNDSINVFNVDKATSSLKINHYEINVPEGSLVIINYAGKNLTFQNAGYVVNGVEASGETNDDHRRVGSKVLLNFYQARNLNVLGGIGMIGSILAPNADLTYQIGVIYGQVIVKNVCKAHQFNWIKFDGEIKLETTITNVAEILSYNEKSSTMANEVGVNFSFAQMQAASLTAVEEIEDSELPNEFELRQNYPNPFNPSTKIEFSIPKEGNYSVAVYNVVGQKVAELMNDELNAGTYSVKFDANLLSSGIYFYKLAGKDVNITRKMILVK